jgi:alanyl-tRNA synthetase
MKLNEIREKFLRYFEGQKHARVPSSSLIPSNDPTLLFVNAGMVQFKDVFLGQDKRPYTRATTAQRCVRAGGKHNDLENVGYTARHHTFFEMLGNFSFGDYFKREAIQYAWEFITQELGIPPEKLWVTVYKEDQEAEDIWLKEMKIDPTRFSRCGEKDNFWSMGDTGPCGPCTEIFYDHGPDVAGGPPGSPDEDGDRYIEIWNLVFMQFNRTADGVLHPLPKPSVDTGMGLERLAAVVQGVHSNYEIDLFQHLIQSAANIIKTTDLHNKSLRVIADHIRACSFLICDSVRPSNEGRGYVLRRIIRRAIRHGNQLGAKEAFFYKLVPTLVKEMSDAYPELKENEAIVAQVLKHEEDQFARTLDQGMSVLATAISALKGKEIPGEVIFKLYDTFGFPVDLTNDIARESELTLDMSGFEKCMAQQRARSQAASGFAIDYNAVLDVHSVTKFTGHDELSDQGEVLSIFVEGQPVKVLKANQHAVVVLDQTSFYAEGGGQVGDQGVLSHSHANFAVKDTTKQGKTHLHHGMLMHGEIKVGDILNTEVDHSSRQATVLNHSATHLLHAALREILGKHVVQKGSMVAPDRLRFDFAHTGPLTSEELVNIENMVNAKIREDAASIVTVMNTEQAKKSGALALFGEKYDEHVRVLEMAAGFSKELCGGTHVDRAGQIGLFKITQETGIAAGIRRIEAVTGQAALDLVHQQEADFLHLADLLKAPRDLVIEKIEQLIFRGKQLEKDNQKLTQQLMMSASSEAMSTIVSVKGVNMLILELPHGDAKGLREAVDQWKQKMGSGVVVLALKEGDKVSLSVGVTADLTAKLRAGDLVNYLSLKLEGKGGGRPDLAQGGGKYVANLDEILASAKDWVKERI